MYNILYLPFTITEKKRTSLVTSNDSKIVHYFIVVLEQLNKYIFHVDIE